MTNEDNKFEIGDIVILKSDVYNDFPTIMTVNEIEMGKVTCVWSTKNHDFLERSFSIDAVLLYKE